MLMGIRYNVLLYTSELTAEAKLRHLRQTLFLCTYAMLISVTELMGEVIVHLILGRLLTRVKYRAG